MTESNTQQKGSTPNQMADQLADTVWKIKEEWGEFARSSVGLPPTRAVDGIGLQLAISLGRKPVKKHLQHISNARKHLTPASYWLQRATARGLIGQEPFRQLADLAKRLDQHAQTVVEATNEKIAEQQQNQKETKETETASAEAITEQMVAH